MNNKMGILLLSYVAATLWTLNPPESRAIMTKAIRTHIKPGLRSFRRPRLSPRLQILTTVENRSSGERTLSTCFTMEAEDLFKMARYGYTDMCNNWEPFERLLVENLKEFVKDDIMFNGGESSSDGTRQQEEVKREIGALDRAASAGIVHLMSQTEVVAGEGAGVGKRILISIYCFLKRNLGQ
ncbi:hypothetical protein Ancab_019489 [Ancistrocladus abbreviatus]